MRKLFCLMILATASYAEDKPKDAPKAPAVDGKEKEKKEKVKDEVAILGVWLPIEIDLGPGIPAISIEKMEGAGRSEMLLKEKGVYIMADLREKRSDEGTYELGTAEKLKTITITTKTGVIKGLYELDGDSLKVCQNRDLKAARPSKFVAAPDDGIGIFVYKRSAIQAEANKENKKDK